MITNVFLSFFEISVSVSLMIVLLLLLSPLLNRRYASRWRYLIWIFLALWLLIPFGGAAGRAAADAWTQRKNQTAPEAEMSIAENLSGQAALPGQIVVEIPAQMTAPIMEYFPDSSAGVTLLDLIAVVWLAGSLIFLTVHLVIYLHYTGRVKKRGTIIKDSRILRRISDLRRELHIKRRVYAVEYPEAASPMITGFLRPVLILPTKQYRSEELYFILKHELVHLKRRDVYVKLLFVLAGAVHWFNPFVWLMRREAVIDMELSCDERVIQGEDYAARRAYTETLLCTLDRQCRKGTALSTQFYGGTQIMKKRFKNILRKTKKRNGALILVCAVMMTMVTGTLTGCSAAKESGEELPARTEKESEEESPARTEEENILTPDTEEAAREEEPAAEIPQNGQIYGYISGYGDGFVTVDRQIWATPENEDWKPEYDDAAGFEVVDAEGGDITYMFREDCTYSVLENHHDPVLELDETEFENYLREMEYPVLWVIELEEGQIRSIAEQYRP